MSAVSRQSAAKATNTKPSAQSKGPAPEREEDEGVGKLLGFQSGFGNQAVQRAGSTCPNLAACPTGGACHECGQQASAATTTPAPRQDSDLKRPGPAPAVPGPVPAVDVGAKEPAAPNEITGSGNSAAPAAEAAPAVEAAQENSAAPDAAAAAPSSPSPTPTVLVDDPTTATDSTQMPKEAFLAELRSQVKNAAEGELAGTGRTAADCPWIEHWFGYYQNRSAERVESALRRWAPQAAGAQSAQDYMAPVVERVRRSVAHWAVSGEVTGVPDEGIASLAQVAAASGASTVPAGLGSLMFKAREGGARAPQDLEGLQQRLGEGEGLDAPVRSRMEAAFGTSFGGVRVHRDANAAALSSEVNARAFALGNHVAFGAGEYRPGSVVGDALIAHELAHVVQQRGVQQQGGGAAVGGGSSDYGALEADADSSAAGVVASMWAGARDGAAGLAARTGPALRSGLRLQRCKGEPTPAPASPTVDAITIVDSAAGAISGYPDIEGNADLNVPGPFNDSTTGECRNTHQIIFHLDAGSSSRLTPSRRAKATVTIGGAEQRFPPDEPGSTGGLTGTRTFDDGPPEHEIQRPDSSRIVIADSPGVQGLNASAYPFIFKTDFTLKVAVGGTDVARVNYEVRLRKENAANVPNTENLIRATEKKDLVRNRDLT